MRAGNFGGSDDAPAQLRSASPAALKQMKPL